MPACLLQVQKDLEYFPFEVSAGPNGECVYNVSGGEGRLPAGQPAHCSACPACGSLW